MAILELIFGYWTGLAFAFPVILILGVFIAAWGRK